MPNRGTRPIFPMMAGPRIVHLDISRHLQPRHEPLIFLVMKRLFLLSQQPAHLPSRDSNARLPQLFQEQWLRDRPMIILLQDEAYYNRTKMTIFGRLRHVSHEGIPIRGFPFLSPIACIVGENLYILDDVVIKVDLSGMFSGAFLRLS